MQLRTSYLELESLIAPSLIYSFDDFFLKKIYVSFDIKFRFSAFHNLIKFLFSSKFITNHFIMSGLKLILFILVLNINRLCKSVH